MMGKQLLPSSVAILGSTGSVGVQAIDVAVQNGIRVDLIAAKSNVSSLEQQIRALSPRYCAVTDEAAAKDLKTRVADTETKVFIGEEGIREAIFATDAPVAVNAVMGEAGLLPTLAVIESGRRLALANKESLIVAGDIVMQEAARRNVEILPVDSEHSAIFQSLLSGRASEVRRILLTASGGPFFGYTKKELSRVTLADTLRHPTWKMGHKITVDSATLMNKGFEVIEAVHLFNVSPEAVTVLVHRESIIHSAVEYIDNTVIAQMSMPDMRACVQYALTYPARTAGVTTPLDLFAVGKLSFQKPDTEVFPLLSLAYAAIREGGAVPAVMNAANEVAVDAFLHEKISFCDISDTVFDTTLALQGQAKHATDLRDILSFDRMARSLTEERLAKKSNGSMS